MPPVWIFEFKHQGDTTMELKVKNIDTKGVQNDSGSITVVNIVKLVGASVDG